CCASTSIPMTSRKKFRLSPSLGVSSSTCPINARSPNICAIIATPCEAMTVADTGRRRQSWAGAAAIRSYISECRDPASWRLAMIYILAVFLPPLALLLNGQPFSALLNFILIWPCFFFGLLFPVLWIVPAAHAVIAIYMRREDRKHREIVDAIERHGPPPG